MYFIRLIPLVVFFISIQSWSQCDSLINREYDEFDKVLTSELENRIVLSTFSDGGVTYIGDHFGFSWFDKFYVKDKKGWIGNNSTFKLTIWSKIQIKDCYNYNCWQLSDTSPRRKSDGTEGYDYKEWMPYLRGEVEELKGYAYVQFLSTNDEVLKVYIKYDNIGHPSILLNHPKYKRTIENYNWLRNHEIKKVRFYNALNDEKLDVDIPYENRLDFKTIIDCIINYKKETEIKYF